MREGREICATDDELRAVVDEARRCDRDVLAHAHSPRAVITASRAGVRSIEHGTFLDEDAVAAMKEHGCWYVPTLAAIAGTDHEPTIAAHHRSLALVVAAGIPVAAGSDLGARPHVDLLSEIRLLARVGLGDAGALKAATSEAARLLRLDHDRGRVAPGLRADLVLLDGAGLNVEDLPSRIKAVWHDGRLVRE